MQPIVRTLCASLSAGAILVLCAPAVAQAQQPARDMLKFQTTVTGTAVAAGIIPMDPPLMVGVMNLKGTSELLGGAVTFTDSHVAHFGIDGAFLRSTDGRGVFTGPNGDSLFAFWDGVGRPTENPDVVQGIAAFTIRGGTGRFAGAVGSGIFNSRVSFKTLEVTQVWEGVVALPVKQ